MDKYDFKNISFVIHIRIDIPERLLNLETVIDTYNHYCDNVEFIIINDDTVPDKKLKPLCNKYKDTAKFLFLENDGTYMRPLSFNRGFCNTDRPLMIAGDTDVLVHPKYIIAAADLITKDGYHHAYPYNGMFIQINEHIRDSFKSSYDFDSLLPLKPSQHNRYPYYKTDDILVAHCASHGGCIMYESKMYRDMKGYNPAFKGWGYEDDEINCRVSRLGYKTARVYDDDAIAWHLPHRNTVRDQHPFYENNKLLFEQTRSFTEEQLREYIKTWEL